jgi:hypothetical protein
MLTFLLVYVHLHTYVCSYISSHLHALISTYTCTSTYVHSRWGSKIQPRIEIFPFLYMKCIRIYAHMLAYTCTCNKRLSVVCILIFQSVRKWLCKPFNSFIPYPNVTLSFFPVKEYRNLRNGVRASSQLPVPWPKVYAGISVSRSHPTINPCYRLYKTSSLTL